MADNTLIAGTLTSALPFYISEDCSLADCIHKMEKYKLSQIVITDSNFLMIGVVSKKQIVKFLLLNRLKRHDIQTHKIKIETLLNTSKVCVNAYMTTSIAEIKNIMDALKLEYIPIVKTPWNKVLVGFLSYDRILGALEKTTMLF